MTVNHLVDFSFAKLLGEARFSLRVDYKVQTNVHQQSTYDVGEIFSGSYDMTNMKIEYQRLILRCSSKNV